MKIMLFLYFPQELETDGRTQFQVGKFGQVS